MSLREKLQKSFEDEGEDFKVSEVDNLMLDDIKIENITPEDKKFLEEFTSLEFLSFNQTNLKSLNNLPDIKDIIRIDMNDNHIHGVELKHLAKYTNLKVLKFAGNLVKEFAELEALKPIKELVSIDLTSNPITEKKNYKEQVFGMFPSLEVLDGFNKEGEEVLSASEMDEDYGSEEYGEEDLIDDAQELDEETLKKLKEQGFDPEKLVDDDDEDDYDDEDDEGEDGEEDEEDEEGDEEEDDDEDSEPAALGKRKSRDEKEDKNGSNKRKK